MNPPPRQPPIARFPHSRDAKLAVASFAFDEYVNWNTCHLQLAGIIRLRRSCGGTGRSQLQPITHHSPLTTWDEGNYGRGAGVGRGEIGVGTGVMRGGAVGRGTGVPEFVRGVGVGRVGGSGSLQGGLHKKPSLYCVRILT
jgi:hypothetical protein